MDRTITLSATYEGYYEPVEKTISIKSINTPYKLEFNAGGNKRGKIFTKIEGNTVHGRIYNASLGCYYNASLESMEFKVLKGAEQFEVLDNRGYNGDYFNPYIKSNVEKSGKCEFTMQGSSWEKPAKLSYTYKVNTGYPIATANKSKIVLNNNIINNRFYSDEAAIKIKTNYSIYANYGGWMHDIEFKDKNGKDLSYMFGYTRWSRDYGANDYETDNVFIYAKNPVKEGMYTVYITPSTEYGNTNVKLNSIKLVIQVVNKKIDNVLNVKGQLDVAKYWDEKQVELVPKITNWCIDPNEFKISEDVFGEDGYLFKVIWSERDEKYYLALKDSTYKLDPKKTYSVDLNLKYRLDYSKPFQSEKVTLKFKPIEKKSKLEPIKKTVTISARQGNYATVPIELKWNEYIEKAIKYGRRVELLNYSKEFSVDSDLGYGYQNDSFNKSMKLFLNTNEVSDLVIGKTYPVKLKITPNAYALEGSSYTVTVYVKVVE